MQGQICPLELLFVTEPQAKYLADHAIDGQATHQRHGYTGQASQQLAVNADPTPPPLPDLPNNTAGDSAPYPPQTTNGQ
ncbi:hypothetical protein NS96R_20150, partial [Pseudomonas parafulva]